jgi:hypothetical protein
MMTSTAKIELEILFFESYPCVRHLPARNAEKTRGWREDWKKKGVARGSQEGRKRLARGSQKEGRVGSQASGEAEQQVACRRSNNLRSHPDELRERRFPRWDTREKPERSNAGRLAQGRACFPPPKEKEKRASV